MRASEAKKASYFLASFLTSFLFLLSLNATVRSFIPSNVVDRRTS